MWCLAEILFAQPKQADRRMYACESCNVLLQANSADEAERLGRLRVAVENRAAAAIAFFETISEVASVMPDCATESICQYGLE